MHSVAANTMLAGPPYLKCIKKFFWNKRIFYFLFVLIQIILEAFQVRRAHRHSVGSDTMPAGSLNLECIKSSLILSGDLLMSFTKV
jgi:hypothetical protein